MSYEISLEKRLVSQSPELHGRLQSIRKFAQPLLSYTHGAFPYYTPHDFSHSTNVEENLNWLIPDRAKEEMAAEELFLLIVAAWLHDWGMVRKDGEDPDDVRDEHHVRTEMNFETLHSKIGLSEAEGRIAGRICKGHRKVDLNNDEFEDIALGHKTIRRRFLAAALRIADECDIACNRTPEVIYYSIEPKGTSQEEFEKHLSITGVGQRTEPHKIYFSAIAKHPRAARVMREVRDKVQMELDGVKHILSDHGVQLDVVELQLETRGFIDKPIAFEMDKGRIVEILIGDHLYGSPDVAVREMVQNSLDSCNLRRTKDPHSSCVIRLIRSNDDTLTVEDNGIGMGYIEAKRYLSTIGASFCNSKAFRLEFANAKYSPIAKYGIGILSTFLMADGISIETRRDGEEPCKFTIEAPGQEWMYERGSLTNTGTRITLRLNESGKTIRLKDSIESYFLCPDIPIEYQDLDGVCKPFESAWSSDLVNRRFGKKVFYFGPASPFEERFAVQGEDFDLIYGTREDGYPEHAILFNHGIFVCMTSIPGLSFAHVIVVNMKKELVDLHISRERVIDNEKLKGFLKRVLSCVFESVRARSKDSMELISSFTRLIDSSIAIEPASLDSSPFVQAFLDHAPCAIVSKTQKEFVTLRDAIKVKKRAFYVCCSSRIRDEMELVGCLSQEPSLVVIPYQTPWMPTGDGGASYARMIDCLMHGQECEKLDLRTLLLRNAKEISATYTDLLPDGVRLVTFPEKVHPIVVLHEQGAIAGEERGWRELTVMLLRLLGERKRTGTYLDELSSFAKPTKVLRYPSFFVDAADEFVSAILKAHDRGALDRILLAKCKRYFEYLSLLTSAPGLGHPPALLHEYLDAQEVEIASALGIAPVPALFERMKPYGAVFLESYELPEGLFVHSKETTES